MKDNTGRVLTIRLTIADAKEAEWLWKAHPEPIHGVVISALSNGDMFEERDQLSNAAAFFIREQGETTEEAVEAHCGNFFNSVDDAAREAPKNVSPGVEWEVVDIRGHVLRAGRAE